MKKIVLLVMGLLFLSGCASAYSVMIDAPDSLPVGKPLIVTGTTTFGIGTPIDVVLYYQLTTTTEIQRKVVYIQSDKTFRTVFDTTGLKTGTYKVEVPSNGGGDSVTARVVRLIDRSDEIILSSPTTQNLKSKMFVAGTIKGDENSGVQIEVIGPNDVAIFGPTFVNTNFQGDFSADVPIQEPGNYDISFTDAKGYIGVRTITILGEVDQPIAVITSATPSPVVSAHTKASQDNPAYFLVKTRAGTSTIYTSSSIDWIVEYYDDKGVLQVVNDMGIQTPENFDIQGPATTIFVKVYPYKSSVTGDVFLYAKNAYSVTVSPTIPAVFAGAALPVTATQKSPLIPSLAIIASVLALAVLRKLR
jgi:hypothetical protein